MYLFHLCFNQCNASLHFGSSKHSSNFKHVETHFPSALGSRGTKLFFYRFGFSLLCGFQPCFSPGGACFVHVFPAFLSTISLHSQTKFFLLCMSSIFLGRRPDGSSLILARHHGIPTRVGTALFRSVFFALGPDRGIRSCILIHLGPGDWRQLRNSNARLLLLFEYSSASSVQSPPVQRVQAPGTPAVSSGPSVSSDSPVSSSGSSNDSP